MTRRAAFASLATFRGATVVALTSQRNPYSGFDDASAWNMPAGGSVSGSKLNFTAVAQFTLMSQAWGFLTPVTPSIPYTFSITADSVTGGPKNYRFRAAYRKGQLFADGASAITVEDTGAVFTLSTGETKTTVFTPPADCTHIQAVLDMRDTSNTAVLDDFTVTG